MDDLLIQQRHFFIDKIQLELKRGIKRDKRAIEKMAASFGITDKTEVKEYTETAIVIKARKLAHLDETISGRYSQIVELYQQQVNLSHRTSQSVMLQQYSTPAPISFPIFLPSIVVSPSS